MGRGSFYHLASIRYRGLGHNLEMAYHILFFLPTASLIGDVYIKLTEVVSSLDVFYSYGNDYMGEKQGTKNCSKKPLLYVRKQKKARTTTRKKRK